MKEEETDVTPLSESEQQQWQRLAYSVHAQLWISDNAKIWTTGTIFVPASLLLFGVPISNPGLSLSAMAVVAAVSLGLFAFWCVIADGHRYHQQRHWNVMHFFEEKYLSELDECKVKDTRKIRIQTARYWILLLIGLCWAFILIFNYVDPHFPKADNETTEVTIPST